MTKLCQQQQKIYIQAAFVN